MGASVSKCEFCTELNFCQRWHFSRLKLVSASRLLSFFFKKSKNRRRKIDGNLEEIAAFFGLEFMTLHCAGTINVPRVAIFK